MAGTIQRLESDAWGNFLRGFRTGSTRESYAKKLRLFLGWASLNPNALLGLMRGDPRKFEQTLLDYCGYLRERGLSGSSIRQVLQAVRHFGVMNDVEEGSIHWSKEEIRKLLEHADVRMRALILLLSSSGIRIGSVEHLRWRHLQEVVHDGKRLAKLIVPEAKGGTGYVTFITPEAYEALLEYKKLREAEGEAFSPDSPLIRVAKWSRAGSVEKGAAIPASSKALRNEIHALWRRAGLRAAGSRRHEVQAVHGFRKFFATRMENAGVGRLVVETLMGHRVGVASNYYKPSEKELLEAYVKAVSELTISEAEEMREEMAMRLEENREKILELERINLELQEKLSMIEKEIARLKEILLGKKKERRK
jgi:integrase